MRKYYIFSYASGLTTSTGFAGYHGRFSIAGKLAIFSTKQKAVDHMDKMTSSEPHKTHKLMSRADARKHFLGDTMEEFNYLIERNIDLYTPEEEIIEEEIEEEIEPDFNEIEDNIIGTFTASSLKYVDNEIEYKGNYNSISDCAEDARTAILTTCNKYLEYPTALFYKIENAKNEKLINISPSLMDDRMKIIPTGKPFVFFLEKTVLRMPTQYIKVVIED